MRLLKCLVYYYADFLRNPDFRGPNFTWAVPFKIALRAAKR